MQFSFTLYNWNWSAKKPVVKINVCINTRLKHLDRKSLFIILKFWIKQFHPCKLKIMLNSEFRKNSQTTTNFLPIQQSEWRLWLLIEFFCEQKLFSDCFTYRVVICIQKTLWFFFSFLHFDGHWPRPLFTFTMDKNQLRYSKKKLFLWYYKS